MSVPLQSVPGNSEEETDSADEAVAQAKHEAAEIIARAHRQAESIVSDARSSSGPAPNPLAALGDNAEEIIGQVRKLIKKQREMQAERQELIDENTALKAERDELVQRLTDAVERMEELSQMAEAAQSGAATAMPAAPPQPPVSATPPPVAPPEPPQDGEDTSLAARLRKAEQQEAAGSADEEDSSLAARLERAERERNAEADESSEQSPPPMAIPPGDEGELVRGPDGRSFYDRHSAKLPRLEGDGGRSVLSAIGDMRPESEPKGRKGRRRKGNK